MQALLLAGGLGLRLRSIINDRPKPMALIEGKPFLEYVIKELYNNNIKDIIIAVGYKGSMIEEYFKDGSSYGMNIKYSYEETQLGTAGAIKNALNLITSNEFFVLNADTFYKVDYKKLYEVHKELNAEMTLVLRRVEDISRYGQALLENKRLILFNEKAQEKKCGTINGGIYLINKAILSYIPDGKVSLENDIIPKLLNEGIMIAGLEENGYFIDIGIPEDYYRFIENVNGGKVK